MMRPRSAHSSRRLVPSVLPAIARIECNKRKVAASGPEPRRGFWPVVIPAIAVALWVAALVPAQAQGNAERGRTVANAAGCVSCHTDYARQGEPYAGGRAMETPFGTIPSPNITPDKDTGIGSWTDAQFVRALREGVDDRGRHLFPVFPYTAFTRMTEADMLDLKAYLFTLPAVSKPTPPLDMPFPFSWRPLQFGWKLLFFKEGEQAPDATQSAEWNRGAYLTRALAHCAECHSPRNKLGALQEAMGMIGTADGPDGAAVPNITPHKGTGIGDWSIDDLVSLLRTGMKPDFDNVQGTMAELIDHGLKDLPEADLRAIAVYVLAQPPVENRVQRRSAP